MYIYIYIIYIYMYNIYIYIYIYIYLHVQYIYICIYIYNTYEYFKYRCSHAPVPDLLIHNFRQKLEAKRWDLWWFPRGKVT